MAAPLEPVRSVCDLHTHTHYSDGRASPLELLEHAVAVGLSTLAITDHDNARGAREVRSVAAKVGLTLVPAAEFTCRWDALGAPPGKTDIDVLGYFLDLDSPVCRNAEQAALADLYERVEDCCTRLTAAGYTVTLADVFAQNPHYAGLLQLVKALLKKGLATSWSAAAALVDKAWQAVRPCNATIEKVIETIHALDGVAVLAHPSLIPWQGGLLPGAMLAQLVTSGLDGIEVYHPRLDEEARVHFPKLAKRFDLVVTGGSDEHGWPSGFPNLGHESVDEQVLAALASRASSS